MTSHGSVDIEIGLLLVLAGYAVLWIGGVREYLHRPHMAATPALAR